MLREVFSAGLFALAGLSSLSFRLSYFDVGKINVPVLRYIHFSLQFSDVIRRSLSSPAFVQCLLEFHKETLAAVYSTTGGPFFAMSFFEDGSQCPFYQYHAGAGS